MIDSTIKILILSFLLKNIFLDLIISKKNMRDFFLTLLIFI